ncbi:MAG: MBL fold metallo-hydrolase [Chloroflexota bacterium]|nr:MBL fold metallo-hydrolase [Chloroflexota bacterium]
MALTVRSLGSGSSGNALLIESGQTLILIDCGIGPRSLAAGLRKVGRAPVHMSAVFLTHEHGDHVRAVPAMLKAKVPIIATAGTARGYRLPALKTEVISRGSSVQVGDLTVTAVQVSHDALEPCGYHIASPHGTLTVLTDLGYPDPSLVEYLALSDLIVLEANHDRRLLQDGPYPTVLKRRIMSHSGHLSNDESAMLVARSIQDGETPEIWLAHLSQINNRPEIALGTVHRILADQGHPPLMISALSRFAQDHVWRYGERSQRPIQSQLPLF